MNIRQQQIFTTQLVTLIAAGVPLVNALQMIREPIKTKKNSKHWLDPILEGLHQGYSFSQCLRNSKENFDAFYCGLVEIGENSGQIQEMLVKISGDLKKSESVHNKLKKALTYPICVLMICLFLIIGMIIWVIPSFENVFASFNASLPPLTAFLMKLSKLVRTHLSFGFFSCFCILSSLYFCWYKLIGVQRWFDRFFLRLPIFGSIVQNALLARWTTTIFILQQSGTPLLKAIRISARCSNHWYIHDISVKLYRRLSQGQSIHQSLLRSDPSHLLFTQETLQLIKVGEESGGLSSLLEYLASFHENKLSSELDVLMEMIEPALVIIMGLIVGGMVIALYLPLFKLGEIA